VPTDPIDAVESTSLQRHEPPIRMVPIPAELDAVFQDALSRCEHAASRALGRLESLSRTRQGDDDLREHLLQIAEEVGAIYRVLTGLRERTRGRTSR